MKKLFLILTSVLFVFNFAFSQSLTTVELDSDVYNILRFAETKGYCSRLSSTKPYSQRYIISKLEEIIDSLENEDDDNSAEIEMIYSYIENFNIKPGNDIKNARIKFSNEDEEKPVTLLFENSLKGNLSGGIYDEKDVNSFGYEVYYDLTVSGDLGKNVSFSTSAWIGGTRMPLQEMGTYEIGPWLYHDYSTPDKQSPRFVKTYKNNSYLPYSHTKYWDGSCYYLLDVSADGLEGWPFYDAFAFAMMGEIRTSFLDDKIQLSAGRNFREWVAMDNGSSLVLNSHARPFFAIETKITPFKWFSISSLAGTLEYPNQRHINENAFYLIDENGKNIDSGRIDDAYFFQNSFALAVVDFDFKYFHFDFGSACVYPKRSEIGYAFPLLDRIVYQNNTGDFDNLSLFGDFKFYYPGLGSLWLSGYLDEVNAMKSKFWEKTRAMYAVQAGTKFIVPFLPFTTASFRYTKVEPYCYTHHSINYTPYYNHYISESYTNNGEGLGYYLPPNSDEFHLKIDTNAFENATFSLQYQLIRHGVDWGSGAGIGNNLYSELRNTNRGDLNKYFLKDGVYEWSNIVSVYGSYDFRNYNLPVKIYANLGFIYDWFTKTSLSLEDIKNENYDGAKKASFHYINNDEYNDKSGFVITVGFSIFN